MRSTHRMRNFIILLSGLILLLPVTGIAGSPENTISLLLTANLNGRFTTSVENQNQEDPMLIMAQSLIMEQKNRNADLLIDLGNAFYPGLLSRFSYGSVMMDYLDYFGFSATLVSSNDLNIGLGNLEFLSQQKKTTLLSLNIEKNGRTVFTPHFTAILKGKKFAFIGITSQKGFLDIAEKELFDASFGDINTLMSQTIDKLRAGKTDFIVVLSGLSYEKNLDLMERHGEISLCISGGDSRGQLYASKANRVDIDSGRSLLTLTQPEGYYTLTLSAGETLEVEALKLNIPEAVQTDVNRYKEFVKRLTLWKSRFAAEGDETIAEDIAGQVSVNDLKTAELLRHRFGVEVAILDKQTVTPEVLSGRVTYSDILALVNSGHPIFTYRISGKELKSALYGNKNLVAAGTDGSEVQGYPISDTRHYLICSPQPVYDKLVKDFGREIKYHNSWATISDEIRADLKGERVIARDNFDYLDRRFGFLMDVYLSNFFDQSDVSREESSAVPPGKPGSSYTKWGVENKVDFTVYNRFHKFILTPYIYYMRQDDAYLQNLLRGAFLYTYNMNPYVNPYHKSQVDTVVEKGEDDLRPMLFRETVGAFFQQKYFNGKLGIGFEKQTQDPEQETVNGLEAILDARVGLWREITYAFNLDAFYGFKHGDVNNHQIRSEITNSLLFSLSSYLGLSATHKWSHFNSVQYKEKYSESQVLFGFDLKTDFKMF